MKGTRIAGLIFLALLWVWLSWALLRHGGGITLKNILIIGMSGTIIFVPLWKKYGSGGSNQDNR